MSQFVEEYKRCFVIGCIVGLALLVGWGCYVTYTYKHKEVMMNPAMEIVNIVSVKKDSIGIIQIKDRDWLVFETDKGVMRKIPLDKTIKNNKQEGDKIGVAKAYYTEVWDLVFKKSLDNIKGTVYYYNTSKYKKYDSKILTKCKEVEEVKW